MIVKTCPICAQLLVDLSDAFQRRDMQQAAEISKQLDAHKCTDDTPVVQWKEATWTVKGANNAR